MSQDSELLRSQYVRQTEVASFMPDFCSCGAQLPPDAVFCHKCGKPQREIGPVAPEPPPEEIVLPPPPVVRETPLPSFRNSIALRIAAMVAVVGTLLSFLPYLNWLAAGYFAVFFYRRRTKSVLNVLIGVRIGWMTGVLMFLITALLLTGFVLLLNTAGGFAAFQAQFRTVTDPQVQQRMQELLNTLRNRGDVALLLAQLFIFITCLSMAGGALAAKLVGR